MSARDLAEAMLKFNASLVSALRDADAGQRRALQADLVPIMRRLDARKDAGLIAKADKNLRRIMGAAWTPSGDMAYLITNTRETVDAGIRERGGNPDEIFGA